MLEAFPCRQALGFLSALLARQDFVTENCFSPALATGRLAKPSHSSKHPYPRNVVQKSTYSANVKSLWVPPNIARPHNDFRAETSRRSLFSVLRSFKNRGDFAVIGVQVGVLACDPNHCYRVRKPLFADRLRKFFSHARILTLYLIWSKCWNSAGAHSSGAAR
jgi:hypothetical protein